jgi:hypothetical protein
MIWSVCCVSVLVGHAPPVLALTFLVSRHRLVFGREPFKVSNESPMLAVLSCSATARRAFITALFGFAGFHFPPYPFFSR